MRRLVPARSSLVGCALACVLLAACPPAPEFQSGEVDTRAPDTTDTTETLATTDPTDATDPTDTTGATDTTDTADTADTTEVAPLVPCARGCTELVAQSQSLSIAALIDRRDGRPVVATFEVDEAEQYRVLLHTWDGLDGSGPWPSAVALEALEFPTELALGQDATNGLHVLLESLTFPGSPTSWHDLDRDAHHGVLVPADTCERPSFRVDASGSLYGACVVTSARELHVLRLAGEPPAWDPTAVLADVGVDRRGVSAIGEVPWGIDTQGHAHAAFRCCTELDPELFHARWDGAQWVRKNLGRTFIGAGAMRAHNVLALVGDAPHVVWQHHDQATGLAELEHAWHDGAWHEERIARAVAQGASLGQLLALEAAPDGTLHLAYESAGELVYRRRDTSGWSDEVVQPDELDVFSRMVLLLDAAGVPHVVFRDEFQQIRWWVPAAPL